MDRPSSHSQKVPYARKEGRKSLFSKMKESMRDMLSPSWLSDLVHNAKKESPVAADRSIPGTSDQVMRMQSGSPGMQDMDISQQTPMFPAGQVGMPSFDAQQSGMNRDPSFKSRGSFLGNGQPRTLDFAGLGQGVNLSEPVASAFQQGNFPPPISEFTSAQLPLARLTEKSDSIMAQEDTLSQRSDGSKSTSGCSSMIPQAEVPRQGVVGDKRKAQEQGTVGGTSPQEQQSAKRQKLHVGSASNQTFSRRLSDSFFNKSSTSTASHRPAFNTTLFGSPLTNESSLLGTSFHESSFYPGKTKFGGRSSLSFRSQKKTVDLNQSLPGRLSVPVKAFMKAKPRLNPNKEAVTSSTAKRILEALDKMPTPLNDAKKIPMVPRQWTESPSFFARDRSSARSGPPTQKLNVSSQISISKNRQVSFAPVGQPKPSTSRAPEETFSMPRRQDTVILNSEAAGSGKMRREKSYHRGSASVKAALEEEDTVIIPDLQTEFTLPVSSMPKFSFAAPVTQPKSQEPVSRPKLKEPVANNAQTRSAVNTESPVKQSLKFTFSSPIIEPVPSNKPASPQKYGAFQFSSPISVEKKNKVGMNAADFSKPFIATALSTAASTPEFSFSSPANKLNMDYSFSSAPKPKPKINGPAEPTGGGLQAASVLKQGSVMDILGGGSFKKSSTPGSQSNNSQTGTGGTELSKAAPLSTLFKQSGWNCDICLLSNKEQDDKCVACQTPKPGGQKPKGTTATLEAPKSDLFAKFQQPSGSWTCDICLIQNKPDDSKCEACQSHKPASKTAGISEAPKTDLFAKFQQPSGSWTCDMCLIQNKPDHSKCEACQSQKPGPALPSSLPLTGSIQPGNWICNKCLIQNKQADTVCGACKTPKSSVKPIELNKSDSLFAKLKPAAGTWECEMCLVQNKGDSNSCVACQTPKPLKFFKHPPGDWTCDTCLVSNKETAVNCVACNYARPGPPRTQTVPSIAKSYTLSQATGFSIPSSSDSIGTTQSSAGGFKFTPPATAGSVKSGFDVSKINEDAKKTSDSKPATGFKFIVDSSSLTSASSGFKFGVQGTSESDKSIVSTSGFKINAVAASTDKQATGFKFGSSDSKSESTDAPLKSAGFQFGKSDSSLTNVSSSASNTASTEGTVFGQKTDSSATKDQLQTTTSVPGGFTFKPSDSLSSAKSIETETTKTVTNSSQSIGGFSFPAVTSTSSTLAATSSNSIGTFSFTATKVTDPNTLSATKKSEAPVSTPAGFAFGQQSSQSNTSNQPFSFAQKTAPTIAPAKRGRDEDTGEPAVKKSPFSFGQTAASSNSSSPFQFGAGTVTTTSSSSTSFTFGQKPTTTSASTGLFAFGQQNSAQVSSTGPSVFGKQSSTPASNSVPSVFGQQNAPVTTSSSGGSTFAFNAQKTTESSASTVPVFGQTNSLGTTSASSAPSLFQFGQTNNTASAAPNFNFSTQSSGQASVFGSSTPSFNFTAQKTETSTAATASGLFKFGASQPAPATTPAFGSASAFGSNSTPAFGTGSGATGAFSGNAPSTTPAFGATPPAFGSSNSNTGQAAPAFGGNLLCVPVPVTLVCLSVSLCTSALSSCSDSSLKTSLSSFSSSFKVSSSCGSMNSTCVTAENVRSVYQTSSEKYNGCDESLSQTCPSKTSLSATVNISSKESFFHGCYEDFEDSEDEDGKSSKTVQDSCSGKQKVEQHANSGKGTAEQTVAVKGVCVDVMCQTDMLSEKRSAVTQTDLLDNSKDLKLGISHCNARDVNSDKVQTEVPVSVKTKELVIDKAQVMSSLDTGLQVERTGKHIKSEDNNSGHGNVLLKSPNKPVVILPNTGVANEPLSCGKLFIVPCMRDCLNGAVRLSPAITRPLMTCKLTEHVEMSHVCHSACGGQPGTTASVSPVFRFEANLQTSSSSATTFTCTGLPSTILRSRVESSLCRSMNIAVSSASKLVIGNTSLARNSILPISTVNSVQFRIGNLQAITSSPVHDNKNLVVSAAATSIFCNISIPASTGKSSVYGDVSIPTSTGNLSLFGNTSIPASTGKSSIFGNTSIPASTGKSSIFGNTSTPASTGNSSIFFGNTSTQASTGKSSVFIGNTSTSASTGKSSVFFGNSVPTSTEKTFVFGNAIVLASTGKSSLCGKSIPASSGKAFTFGNNVPASSSKASTFGNSVPARSGKAFIFGNSIPASSGKSSIFGHSIPACSEKPSIFGNSIPASTGKAFEFGNSIPANSGKSSIFGHSVPASSEKPSIFGNSIQASTGKAFIFGNSIPASSGKSSIFGNSIPASSGKAFIFGNSIPASSGKSSIFGNSIPASSGKAFIFGNSIPASSGKSSIFGNSIPASSGKAFIFGNSIPASSGKSSVFGHSVPASSEKPSIFGNSIPARTGKAFIFGNSIPASSGKSSIFGNSIPTSTGKTLVFGSVIKPAGTGPPVPCNAVSAGSSFPMNNKSGFVLDMPFKSNMFQDKHQSVTTYGPVVSHSVSMPSRRTSMFQTSLETPKKTGFHLASNRAGCFSNNPVKTTNVNVLACRSGENIEMQSESTDYGHKTEPFRSTESEGVFSFQGPSVVNDVVMEDCSQVSTGSNQSSTKQSVVQAGPSRRVAFSFSPPQVANDGTSPQKQQPSPINKTNKSILKVRTKEMVTAFDAATVCGGNEKQDKSDHDTDTRAVFKAPSVSSIFGGKKIFGDVGVVQVCNSKSVPVGSNFVVKGERHGSMDISSGYKEHEQKAVNFGSKGSKSSPNIHSAMFSKETTRSEHNTTPSVRFLISVLENRRDPASSTNCVNILPVTSTDSVSTGLFTFSPKPATSSLSGRKTPPPFKQQNTTSPVSNCRLSETIAVTSGFSFSPMSQNLFVFSANGSSLSNTSSSSSLSSRKVKDSRIRSGSKHSAITAFCGKSEDKSVMLAAAEASPSASRGSRSSHSSNSGSDVSRSSSSCSSSDSNHSVSSASSSSTSSASSVDCDDHNNQSDSLPMEDDLCRSSNSGDSGKDDVHMDFSCRENKSWNACPVREKYFFTSAKKLILPIEEKKLNAIFYLGHADRLHLNYSVRQFISDEFNSRLETGMKQSLLLPSLYPGVFGNPSQPTAPAQSNAVFQFGAKPADSSQAAPSVGFNFSASANPAGLGANFNFSAQAAPVNAFSATGPGTPTEGRKIKKAARRIKR